MAQSSNSSKKEGNDQMVMPGKDVSFKIDHTSENDPENEKEHFKIVDDHFNEPLKSFITYD